MIVDPFELPPKPDPEDGDGPAGPVPDAVRKELDARLARMNEPGVRERMQAAFDATPEELGRAATEAAKKNPPEDP